jgi:hypothetical protein
MMLMLYLVRNPCLPPCYITYLDHKAVIKYAFAQIYSTIVTYSKTYKNTNSKMVLQYIFLAYLNKKCHMTSTKHYTEN